MSLDDLLTEPQLSDRTGIPQRTLRQWRYLGTGPAYVKLGGRHVRYTRAAVEQWLADNSVATRGA